MLFFTWDWQLVFVEVWYTGIPQRYCGFSSWEMANKRGETYSCLIRSALSFQALASGAGTEAKPELTRAVSLGRQVQLPFIGQSTGKTRDTWREVERPCGSPLSAQQRLINKGMWATCSRLGIRRDQREWCPVLAVLATGTVTTS